MEKNEGYKIQRKLKTAVVNPFFFSTFKFSIFLYFSCLNKTLKPEKRSTLIALPGKYNLHSKNEVEIWMFSQKLVQVMYILIALIGFSSLLF